MPSSWAPGLAMVIAGGGLTASLTLMLLQLSAVVPMTRLVVFWRQMLPALRAPCRNFHNHAGQLGGAVGVVGAGHGQVWRIPDIDAVLSRGSLVLDQDAVTCEKVDAVDRVAR